MAAPKNNQFWKARSKHGRAKIFESPKILWEAACEYFEWVDENPWYHHDPVKAGPNFGDTVLTPINRPMTIDGFCIFTDIDENTFRRYCEEDEYKDFWAIANKIRKIIRTQKFEGAAVGVFNANIIARDLGLKEHSENTVKGNVSIEPKQFIDDTDAQKV